MGQTVGDFGWREFEVRVGVRGVGGLVEIGQRMGEFDRVDGVKG